MLEFVLVLVAKMYSPITNGANYLRHLFSTSFSLNSLLDIATSSPFIVVLAAAWAVYWRSYLRR
jgi:hypothetical protein